MSRSIPFSPRVRTRALAAIFSFTTFAVEAAPTTLPIPRPDALLPEVAQAAFCAGNAAFSGRLTASSSSTTAVSRITNGTVYGYISNVDAAWSCTAYLRYSGVAWNTTASAGRFDWGNLINSTSVACNYVAGSTDYVKANSSADCPDTDAEYAMAVSLSAQRVYRADVAHTEVGDLSFVQSDCGTYYGAETIRGTEAVPQSFASTNVNNRPGDNCDPLTLDNFGTSQVITYDSTAPTGTISIAGGAGYTATTAVTLTLSASDEVARLGDMSFSNDNLNWSAWQTYATSKAWTLASGDGTKTVYVKYRDLNLNVSGSFSDTIVLDTLDPTGSILIAAGATYTTTTAVTLTLTQADATSGPFQHRFSNDGVWDTEAWEAVAGTKAWTLPSGDGTKTVSYQVKDNAGRTSTTYSDTIVLDQSPGVPNPPDVACTGTAVYQSAANTACFFRPAVAATVTTTATVSDPQSGIAYVRFQNLSPTTGWTPSPVLPNQDTTPAYSEALGFSGSAVSATMEVLARNGAGTDGSIRTVTLTADSAGPTATFTNPPAGTMSQPSDTVTVIWTESDGTGSGVLSRSLNRERATPVALSCSGASFADDPTVGPSTAASPVTESGLLVNTCYRWVQTLTDRVGNSLATPSGAILRDTTANLGQQRQHTLESWDLGGSDALAVNAANGNLVLTHPIVSLPIRGSSVALGLIYNSQDAANVGMGPGWRLNVFRRLTLNADGTVTFVDADGARYTFTNPVVNGTVTTYTRPAALYATLVKDTSISANEFVLSYRDLAKDKFDILGSEGILVREEDRFANGATIAYTGGTNRISTITDTAGSRTMDFTWDGSNRLTQITDWAWTDGSGVVQTSATGARRAYRFFYDGSSRLAGWSDPLNSAGSCPTGGTHLTCIAYPTNGLDVSKTQTVTTAGATSLGTSTRTITTKVAISGSNVASVKDAQQVFDAGTGITLTWESPTRVRVDRPGTPTQSTAYALVGQNDTYARIQSAFRDYPEGSVEIERRTSWDATYPTEPAAVTDNYGALLSTPARTTSYTYVASSLGLVSRITEPLTATDDRWTDFVYNVNNDVTQQTVSLEGSPATVTRYCYTTQSLTCPTNETGLTLVRQIANWVSGGAQDDDTNVATDYTYDAYGRQIRVTRHNRAPDGSVRDDRVDAMVFDTGNLGNLEREITNYVDGVVSNGTLDTAPGTDSVRTDLTTVHAYDTAGNRVSTADPRRAIGLVIPATTQLTFTPDDDAHVRDANPTTNYGSDTTLQVRATGGSQGAYEPYLKFTVTGLVGTVTGATLRLQNTATANRNGRNVCAYRVPVTTWTEGAVTWNTKPASDAASLACVVGDQAAGSIDFALSEGAVTGPGLHAFRLTNDTTFEVVYASTEHASLADPQLIVTVGYGPLGADDYVTRWTYDGLNQALTERTPSTYGVSVAQKTSGQTFDELGAVRQATDFGGNVTGTESDRAGRALTMFEDTDGAGSGAPATTSVSTYDVDGRVLTAKDRRQAADGTLGLTDFDYDSLARQIGVTEAAGGTGGDESATAAAFDTLDRRVSLDVAGQITDYMFDLGGRVVETDDGFACTTQTFDYRGLQLTSREGLAGTSCSAAANTRTVTTSYDSLGRGFRAEVTEGAGLGDRTSDDTLDSAGNRLSSATRTSGVTAATTFTVTKLDRTIVEGRPDGSTSKATIDAAGNVADRCYWKPGVAVGDCKVVGTPGWTDPPSQSTSATYDARNQRIQLVDGLTNGVTTYDPDHNYQVAATYLPTSSGREFQSILSYDARHRLTGITHQLCVLSGAGHACTSMTPAGSNAYAYDDNDNRTTVNESNGTASSDRRYCHDARNQIVYRNTAAACSAAAKDEANTFDDAGNRLTALAVGVTTNFAYTADGQLCDVETAPTAASCSGGNVTYDTAGRTRSQNGWWFAYDSESRLTLACKSATCAAGSDKVEMTYDGEGHRTQLKTTSAAGGVATRDFRYQGGAIVEERLTDAGHPTGTVVRSYITDESGGTVKVIVPAGESDAGTYLVTWNGHGDALALWREESDGSLLLANSFTYDTWGTPSTATHNGVADLGFRFLYVGRADVQWDDVFGLGLLYMHARHYDPTLGRFVQPDPSATEANAYAYAKSNPVTRIDATGKESWAPNAAEIRRCLAYPGQCYWWARSSATAFVLSKPIQDGWKENAYRHCIWQCLLTYRIGWDAAEKWGNAHEAADPTLDKRIDQHNNYVGRLFGQQLHRVTWAAWPSAWAFYFCDQAWKRGWLWKAVRRVHGFRIVWSDGRAVR